MSEHHEHHNHAHKHVWPFLGEIEKIGDDYLVKKAFWQMPASWKDFIVKVLPWLVIISAILSIPAIVGGISVLFGLSYGGPFRGPYWGGAVPVLIIQIVVAIAVTVLHFKAFDPLRKKQYMGRAFAFYAGLVSFIGNLLDGGVIGALIGLLLGMYILFQIKERYHS